MSDWPTREDGSNKTVGEMTAEERRRVLKASCDRLQKGFDHPRTQAVVEKIINE